MMIPTEMMITNWCTCNIKVFWSFCAFAQYRCIALYNTMAPLQIQRVSKYLSNIMDIKGFWFLLFQKYTFRNYFVTYMLFNPAALVIISDKYQNINCLILFKSRSTKTSFFDWNSLIGFAHPEKFFKLIIREQKSYMKFPLCAPPIFSYFNDLYKSIPKWNAHLYFAYWNNIRAHLISTSSFIYFSLKQMYCAYSTFLGL